MSTKSIRSNSWQESSYDDDCVYDTKTIGHTIYFSGKDMNNNRYLPRDEKGRFISEWKLKCPMCKRPVTKKDHDPCIANLPGVKNACCGHGGEGYIQFENGITIRGNFKVKK